MQYVGPDVANDLVEPPAKIADDFQLADSWQFSREPRRRRRTQKFPVADPLARRPRCIMLAACQQHWVPAECPLLINDAESAVNVAALQRQRMIEDVKYAHR